MPSQLIRACHIDRDEAERLASEVRLAQPNYRAGRSGISAKAARIFGWSPWQIPSGRTEDIVLLAGSEPLLILRLEDDRFNSICTHVPQARLHWLLGPRVSNAPELIADLADALAALLAEAHWKLISLRVVGSDPYAFALFQRAGFHVIVGNAWFYRWPVRPAPTALLPRDVTVEWFDLRQSPLDNRQHACFLQLAAQSFIPDRFACDPLVNLALARERFLQLVANALAGEIADYVLTASIGGVAQALLFFGIAPAPMPETAYPVAGRWLTALARPHLRARGLALPLFAEAIRSLPEGQANWTYSCTLDHFASLGASRKLGFQLGAVAYDLHWWHTATRMGETYEAALSTSRPEPGADGAI